MTIEVGINAYVSLDQAETYFEGRLDAAPWTDLASEDDKEKALITAATYMDTFEWSGVICDPNQTLSFPRKGKYLNSGSLVDYPENTVPQMLIKGYLELAYHLLNNDGLFDNTGGVTKIKVGSIELEEISNAPAIPHFAYNIFRNFLKSTVDAKAYGGQLYWRAW